MPDLKIVGTESAKQRAAQLDRQLNNWEKNSVQNAREQSEFKRLRALGKLPSVVDTFDVKAYQRHVYTNN